jgi:hypothetical protein
VATFAIPFEVLKKKTPSGPSNISLAEVLSALSFALDLTEGAVPGHALRSCVIGMRLAKELDLPTDRPRGPSRRFRAGKPYSDPWPQSDLERLESAMGRQAF